MTPPGKPTQNTFNQHSDLNEHSDFNQHSDLNEHSDYLDNLCFYSQLCTTTTMNEYVDFMENYLQKKS